VRGGWALFAEKLLLIHVGDGRDVEMSSVASEEVDRKLWFDLISKLNDRNLQRARESGATAWVLLGVATAIIYKGTPALPSILSSRSEFSTASILFVLLFDLLTMLSVAWLLVALYVEGEREMRLMTELSLRARNVLVLMISIFALGLSSLHIWLAATAASGTVKSTLIVFGIFWAINILAHVVKMIRRARAAKRLRTALPEFGGVEIPSQGRPVAAVVFFLISCGLFWVILRYLTMLSQSRVGMLSPLAASSHFLALIVICSILFGRAFIAAPHRDAFLALEQAIIVEGLGPSEIRSRFVMQLIGSSAADWLQKIADQAKAADVRLSEAVARVAARLPEVEAISIEYGLERAGRLRLFLNELRAASDAYDKELDACIFQLEEYSKFPMSLNEYTIFRGILAERRAAIQRSKEQSGLQAMLKRIETLALCQVKDSVIAPVNGPLAEEE
jgi:hypothetical protein